MSKRKKAHNTLRAFESLESMVFGVARSNGPVPKTSGTDALSLARIAHDHRTDLQFMSFLRQHPERYTGSLSGQSPISKYLRARLAPTSFSEIRTAVLTLVQEVAPSDSLFIKGVPLGALYSAESPRVMNDVDVVLRRVSDLWGVLGSLMRARFSVGAVTLKVASGQSVLAKVTMFRNGEKIDVHAGGYSCRTGVYEAPLWERSQRMVVDGVDVLVPSHEDSLLILCAHILDHGLCRFRDFNDTYLLLSKHGQHMDWSYIIDTAQRNHLVACLEALVRSTEAFYAEQLPVSLGPSPSPVGRLVARRFFGSSRARITLWSHAFMLMYMMSYEVRRYGVWSGTKESLLNLLKVLEGELLYAERKAGTVLSTPNLKRCGRHLVALLTREKRYWVLRRYNYTIFKPISLATVDVESFANESSANGWIQVAPEAYVASSGKLRGMLLTPIGFCLPRLPDGTYGLSREIISEIADELGQLGFRTLEPTG